MTSMHTDHKTKLMHDLRMVIDDAQELLRMTADQVGEGAVGVRARICVRGHMLVRSFPSPSLMVRWQCFVCRARV